MDPATIIAAVTAIAQLAKAAPGIIDQAHKLLTTTDDAELKVALAGALATYEIDHARVMDKLRAAQAR